MLCSYVLYSLRCRWWEGGWIMDTTNEGVNGTHRLLFAQLCRWPTSASYILHLSAHLSLRLELLEHAFYERTPIAVCVAQPVGRSTSVFV